jgi:hypothetical protein
MIQTCTQQDGAWGNLVQTGVRICLAGILTSAVAASALAGDAERQQAKRIHDRLTGVAPTEAVLDAMEQSIIDNSGSGVAAAELAMDPAQNPLALNFYNVTL